MHSDAAIAKMKSGGTSFTGAFDAARNRSLESGPQTVVQFSVAGTRHLPLRRRADFVVQRSST